MEKSILSMSVSATGPGTTLTVRLNESVVWQGDPGHGAVEISHEFDDNNNTQYLLSIEMSGKITNHTKINDAGEIINDLLVNVNNFSLDTINIDQLIWDLSEYHHDFNGTRAPIIDKFYGHMGCNGTVTMRFFSPVYVWLLENL